MLELKGELKEEIKKANFGLERECIRVDGEGKLSHKPHPECFGDKLVKKHITTDFSESQIEMITPIFNSIDEVYDYAEGLYDFVCSNLDDEYLWCQSMPCIICGEIPVARYEGEMGIQATRYREMLVERYGGEKQLISGIHFNFSFADEFLKQLYDEYGSGEEYQLFVNNIYLKVARNYNRYGFLITYLCSCSNVCHKTYEKACIATLDKKDEESYCTKKGVSLRNSKWGYRNLVDLFPDFDSAKAYVDSIYRFIDEGHISYPKEYYSSIRLKTVNQQIDTLVKEGIKYIELRTVDINPFDKVGVNSWDLKFIHVFLILMLLIDEEWFGDYQKECLDAKENISLYGLDTVIRMNGKEYKAKDKCLEIIDMVSELNNELGLYDKEIIDFQRDKVMSGGYAQLNMEMDYIKGTLELMKNYKVSAVLGASALTQEQIDNFLE